MEENQQEFKLDNRVDYRFAVWLDLENYSRNTLRNFVPMFRKLLGKNRKISNKSIDIYIHNNPTAPKKAFIKLLLRFLEEKEGIVLLPPKPPRIVKQKKDLEIISKEDFNMLLKSIEPRFQLFMEIMYYGGLRVSEVARIETDWFNWVFWFEHKEQYGELTIFKGKWNRTRIVPIPPELMQKIWDYAPKRPDYNMLLRTRLFDIKNGKTDYKKYVNKKKLKGVPMHVIEQMYTGKVIRSFQNSLARVSMEELGKRVKTHMLRASRATHLDEKGLSATAIQYMLGHESLATTSKYIYNTPEKLKKQLLEVEKNEMQSS